MWWDRIITAVLVLTAAAWMLRLGWRTVRSWRRGGACQNCASGGCNTESAVPTQTVVPLSLDEPLRRRAAEQSHPPENPVDEPAGVAGQLR